MRKYGANCESQVGTTGSFEPWAPQFDFSPIIVAVRRIFSCFPAHGFKFNFLITLRASFVLTRAVSPPFSVSGRTIVRIIIRFMFPFRGLELKISVALLCLRFGWTLIRVAIFGKMVLILHVYLFFFIFNKLSFFNRMICMKKLWMLI